MDNTMLLDRVKEFPEICGVYVMKDSRGKIVYIGKASSLRARVRSYFHRDQEAKTRALMQRVARIEYIVTNSVYEALLLECNLIKQWRPKYNIDLKDGKSYPMVRITNERYPRVFKTRSIVKDGSKYFGPYINAGNVSRLLDEILRVYPLRKCRGEVRARPHPCLHYHIGRCSAACAGKISHDDYQARVKQIRAILAGETLEITKHLHLKIATAIKEQQFEKAGVFRDALMAIKMIEQGQHIVDFDSKSIDYFGHASHDGRTVIAIFKTREGKLVGSENYHIVNAVDIDEQVAQVIIQYYETAHQIPEQLVVSSEHLNEELARYFEQERERTLRVHTAESDREHSLMRLLLKNARASLLSASTSQVAVATAATTKTATHTADESRDSGHSDSIITREGDDDRPYMVGLDELQQVLELPQRPHSIEGFDIAHVGGRHTVAAMVAFRNGTMAKSEYRRYRIASLADGQVDDFEAMREVVARRYTRLLNETTPLPQLILIDGGIGQVNAAAEVLRTLGIGNTPLVGIAKRNEELYTPHSSNPLLLPRRSPALRLLQAVRDEAHRFATSYRASKQRRAITQSELRGIAGIGPSREARLYRRYNSLAEMDAASVDELATTLGMGVQQTQAVKEALHKLVQSGE